MSLIDDLIPVIRTIDDHIDDFEETGVEMKGNNGIVSAIRSGRDIRADRHRLRRESTRLAQ
jgi:hypothetical protein